MNFIEGLKEGWKQGKFLCLGLDPDLSKLPQHLLNQMHMSDGALVFEFNRNIILNTFDLVLAYKPNIAFYEGLGADGFDVLNKTIRVIRDADPKIPIILDFKRGDIGNTNIGYVDLAFNELGVDAVTLSPYMGKASLEPFLELHDKGAIIICKTSNPESGEFQDLNTSEGLLYEVVAKRVANNWNKNGNCALVVGATYPADLKKVRELAGNMPILIPGIGKQGGDLIESVKAGLNLHGDGIIINSSRDILYASSGEDYALKARERAELVSNQIRDTVAEVKKMREPNN